MVIVVETVKQHLEIFRTLREQEQRARPLGWRWTCVEDLLLKEGRAFPYAPLPKPLKYGPIKACYANAYRLASRRSDLTYVEGYAHRYIPCWHAWCVTADGTVVDPTWRPEPGADEPRLREYWGIPFKLDYVTAAIIRQGTYGVLYDRELMMLDNPDVFLQPL